MVVRFLQYEQWKLDYQGKHDKEDKDFRIKMTDDDRTWQRQQQTRLTIIAGAFVILGAIIGGVIAIFH